jgi:formamidopyrimidine-DNA glycosylase
MPELPEVETTVNDLKPHVTGKTISGVDVLSPNTIAEPSPDQFRKGLVGRKILEIRRRGKHLIFDLDSKKVLIVHLRMTGALLVKPSSEKPEKFVRVVIVLDNAIAVHFRDVRRFGRMWLLKDESKVVGKLGPEPLSPDFTPEVLAKILAGRSAPVKALLLDQTLIAGIGNMYADEALYSARIHPSQSADSLKKAELKRLHSAIQEVLHKGIKNKGASTDTYFRPSGTKGAAHLEFQVAHRKGEDCPVCGGSVQRIVVRQRGTFFCPACQKLHK